MSKTQPYDWDPRSPEVLENQIAAYDDMRARCPVARSRHGYTSLLKHADVLHAVRDHDTYSNAVSRFPSVPNGMDPPEHTHFRRVMEPYFAPERMQAFEPVCRTLSRALVQALPGGQEVELMQALAWPFALHVQCAFMGWPQSLHEPLREWVAANHEATLRIDREAMATVATTFDSHVREQLALRRDAGAAAPDDVTTRLLHEQVQGRPLAEDEIISIVRNWTVGELGTLAASVGILAEYLARNQPLQQQLREHPERLDAAADEILRMNSPLILNRRRVTRDVTLRRRKLRKGERIALIWASANRDEEVFGDPDDYQPERNAPHNLLYGAGIHVCPGAPLARLELRVLLEELLGATTTMAPGAKPATPAAYPGSGFSELPLRLTLHG